MTVGEALAMKPGDRPPEFEETMYYPSPKAVLDRSQEIMAKHEKEKKKTAHDSEMGQDERTENGSKKDDVEEKAHEENEEKEFVETQLSLSICISRIGWNDKEVYGVPLTYVEGCR